MPYRFNLVRSKLRSIVSKSFFESIKTATPICFFVIIHLIVSVSVFTALPQDLFGRKPNCFLEKAFVDSKKDITREYIAFSKHLPKVLNRLIGRKLSGSSVGPDLCKGYTLAFFKNFGKMPVSIEALKPSAKKPDATTTKLLSTLPLMPSWPAEFFCTKVFIIF